MRRRTLWTLAATFERRNPTRTRVCRCGFIVCGIEFKVRGRWVCRRCADAEYDRLNDEPRPRRVTADGQVPNRETDR